MYPKENVEDVWGIIADAISYNGASLVAVSSSDEEALELLPRGRKRLVEEPAYPSQATSRRNNAQSSEADLWDSDSICSVETLVNEPVVVAAEPIENIENDAGASETLAAAATGADDADGDDGNGNEEDVDDDDTDEDDDDDDTDTDDDDTDDDDTDDDDTDDDDTDDGDSVAEDGGDRSDSDDDDDGDDGNVVVIVNDGGNDVNVDEDGIEESNVGEERDDDDDNAGGNGENIRRYRESLSLALAEPSYSPVNFHSNEGEIRIPYILEEEREAEWERILWEGNAEIPPELRIFPDSPVWGSSQELSYFNLTPEE
ncbi:serine-aspartate repeat-containing protein C-like [Odontomachus brunneus]|uniref:serine-aspartate repeat-containing protein C-like n=1 Tax=Odontomachus brunneus TaxID=486640 RepID=UPI0013F21483|nr:serine-aspartate repeat-containing protein C-like [Odontomachus brunneus]